MIYDCFTFRNELDLLELRLRYLSPVVDRFVIVEAPTTFSGQKKPLYFKDHQERFASFLPKITLIAVELTPSANRWDLEYQQRNAIALGLDDARDDDHILVGDVDEIPNRNAVGLAGAHSQLLFRFYVDNLVGADWRGTIGLPRRDFRKYYNDRAQDLRNDRLLLCLAAGPQGWHFSALGTPEEVREKLAACSHDEDDNEGCFRRLMQDRSRAQPLQLQDARYASIWPFLSALPSSYFTEVQP